MFIEYAQAEPEDILMQVTVFNRGPEAAPLHVLPQLWFRNTWSWQRRHTAGAARGRAPQTLPQRMRSWALATCMPTAAPVGTLFTDNDSNAARLWGTAPTPGYWKDAFHERVVHGHAGAVSPQPRGTKAAFWYEFKIAAHSSARVRLRLAPRALPDAFADFQSIFAARAAEASEFYAQLQAGVDSEDARSVQRQAWAGMIWSKQFFHVDMPMWLLGDPTQPQPPASRRRGRNHDWQHLNNADIISDARQVGVPLVRRLGSRVSVHCACAS